MTTAVLERPAPAHTCGTRHYAGVTTVGCPGCDTTNNREGEH